MSDDAEWVEVDNEFGVPSAKPSHPRFPTERPFWLPSTRPPRNTPAFTTPWPPRYPYSTPFTPHDSPELAPPLESTQASLGVVLGVVGGVLLLLIVGLLVYMVLLRRRLSKEEQKNDRNIPTNDYSLRIEDVAHLSTPLDDSSQLYVNTSDLHKLVSSVKASRKNPPPAAPSEPRGRPMCPIPSEPAALPISDYRKRPKNENVVSAGLNRLSERFSAINFSGFNLKFGSKVSSPGPSNGPNSNAGYESSMPDIVQIGVPDVLDDDDLWSEDSFDSCSIGYENETSLSTSSRAGSTRRSLRQNHLNRSARSQKKSQTNKISPPSMPPPPPPTWAPVPSAPIQTPSPANSGDFNVVRKAPPPPLTAKNSTKGSAQPTSQGASVTHAAIHVPQPVNQTQNMLKSQSDFVSSPENVSAPTLPTGSKPGKHIPEGKPAPPTAPKPTVKPQLRPKLNMRLVTPPKKFISSEATPDTATTLLSSTPALDGHPFGSRSNCAPLFEAHNQRTNQTPQSSEPAVMDPSNLSVSARRALLEGKTTITSGIERP